MAVVKRLCAAALVILGISFALPAVAPREPAPFFDEKRHAVKLAAEARSVIGDRLLGVEYSETTTTVGHRDAKILSMAPDFPALLVQWLHEAGIHEGDAVAINASGSFPGLVIATLAAVDAIKAKPLLITSLGASSWGANRPDCTWAHMEKMLRERWTGWKSIAVSLGGDGDTAQGMDEEGRRMLRLALLHAGVPPLAPESDEEVISIRMRLWAEYNNGQLPNVLVNVGGNEAFWGTTGQDAPTAEGLLLPGAAGLYGDGVGKLFNRAGKPVIHLLGIKKIAARHGISIPADTSSPIWWTSQPSYSVRLLSIASLLAIMAILPQVIRSGIAGIRAM